MTEEKKPKQRDILARVCIVLIFLVLLGIAGLWFLNKTYEDLHRLSARWEGNEIHVASMQDGPWLVTHLVAYQNGYWHAVAQLTKPVTIIDSYGHYFSQEELAKLDWVDSKGEKQAPPAVGSKIGVMYIIPIESNRPPKN
jgi:hypothetical protein